MSTFEQQRTLLQEEMQKRGITQAQLARMIGRTEKHVSRVLTGKAGTHEFDYWAFVIGLEFAVQIRERHE